MFKFDNNHFAVLLTVFSNSKISLIMELTKDEIERHPQNDKGYLFRDNTITTALIVALFQSPPTNIYLDNVFNKITSEINTRVKVRLQFFSSCYNCFPVTINFNLQTFKNPISLPKSWALV